MQISPYLSFDGRCEAAFKFYEKVFGGQLGGMFPYAGSPMADQVPADWQGKVMHGSVTVGDLVLMGADIAKGYEEPRGFSLSIQVKDTNEAERLFGALGQGGRIVLPLEKTFWAARFGILVDQFGIQWLVNCEGPGGPAEA